MSAYIVTDQCINRIVTYLYSGPNRQWERRIVEEALTQQGSIGATFEEKLANAMFELNCNAVEQRYGDGQAKEFRDLDFTFKREYVSSGYQVYDLLGEWTYQCSEGDVPENSKLFQAIDQIYNSMAHNFFRDLRDRKVEQDNADRRELEARIAKLEALLSPKRKSA